MLNFSSGVARLIVAAMVAVVGFVIVTTGGNNDFINAQRQVSTVNGSSPIVKKIASAPANPSSQKATGQAAAALSGQAQKPSASSTQKTISVGTCNLPTWSDLLQVAEETQSSVADASLKKNVRDMHGVYAGRGIIVVVSDVLLGQTDNTVDGHALIHVSFGSLEEKMNISAYISGRELVPFSMDYGVMTLTPDGKFLASSTGAIVNSKGELEPVLLKRC